MIEKILLLPKPSIYIKQNEDEIFKIIPELEKCKDFNQNNIWHIYDVYNHTLSVVDNVPSDLNLRLAALFHDIGKPDTYTEDENGVGHFYGHWDKSKEIFESFAKRNNMNNEQVKQISKIIQYHDINLKNLSEKEINDLLKTFSIEELKMLFKLKKADLLSQNTKYHYLLENYNEQQIRILKLKEKI